MTIRKLRGGVRPVSQAASPSLPTSPSLPRLLAALPTLPRLLAALLVAGGLGLSACQPAFDLAHLGAVRDSATITELRGQVSFALSRPATGHDRAVQASLAEVANQATVSLMDAVAGNTVASSVTDSTGAFVLTFGSFVPQASTTYILEAVKGLAAGGNPNRPGAAVVRVRTLLLWDSGWKSLTNTTPGVGIGVSPATTAVATIVSLRQSAGQSLTLQALVGKINGATFTDTGTGLDAATDYDPVLTMVSNALSLDQDPVGSIAYESAKGTYRLTTGTPLAQAWSPAIPSPGGTLTFRGANFDPIAGRSTFFFGGVPAATWSVTADRTAATVTIPPSAYSAPVTLMQPNGVRQTLIGFLKLRGTVGTVVGSNLAAARDGVGGQAALDTPFGLVRDSRGYLYFIDVQQSPRVYRLRKMAPDRTVSLFAGASTRCTATELAADPNGCNADGTGIAAKFTQPENLAIDQAGSYVYVSDEGAGRVRKIDTATGAVTTLRAADNSVLSFSTCTGISVDAANNVYVVEYSNTRIKKVTPQGAVSIVATLPTPSFGLRILPDGSGGYVSLYAQHRIGKLTASGGTFTVSVLAGSGAAGSADGAPGSASFYYPITLEPEPGGTVLVADSYNNRIRRVTPAGVVSTVTGGPLSFLDGTLGSALFGPILGLALDPDGSFYLSDSGNHRIRVATP